MKSVLSKLKTMCTRGDIWPFLGLGLASQAPVNLIGGTLKYWFRGVENYAPWVKQIHFVTCGHLPEWLNINHPKIHIVNHKDYIPEQYLPTFSSHVIELNMHRIPGLSEHFVNFNDDVFLTQPVKPEDFFQDGKPLICSLGNPLVNTPQNNIEVPGPDEPTIVDFERITEGSGQERNRANLYQFRKTKHYCSQCMDAGV